MAKYLDDTGLSYLWGKIKALFVPQTRTINGKALDSDIALTADDVGALTSDATYMAISGVTTPDPWEFEYDSDGEVLGVVKDSSSYTQTIKEKPYNIEWEADITDIDNGYGYSDNTLYATLPTATTARTGRIYIDTQIPPNASISSFAVTAKIGTNNISPSVWTTHTYTIKCGANTLASGNFTLSTGGGTITASVDDVSLLVSPIIVIEFTAQTTDERQIRVYGADVQATFTATQKYVSLIRQSQIASEKGNAPTKSAVESVLSSETWTFTLADDSTVTKTVVLK